MSELPEIRIADEDRERVVGRLRAAYAEGRLDQGELDDRLATAYAARFEADLVPLVADLPGQSAPVVREPRRLLPSGWQAFTFAPLICTAIWAMTDFGGYFWPMWVWFGCSIPLLASVLFRR